MKVILTGLFLLIGYVAIYFWMLSFILDEPICELFEQWIFKKLNQWMK